MYDVRVWSLISYADPLTQRLALATFPNGLEEHAQVFGGCVLGSTAVSGWQLGEQMNQGSRLRARDESSGESREITPDTALHMGQE